jgi:hypothetical protein
MAAKPDPIGGNMEKEKEVQHYQSLIEEAREHFNSIDYKAHVEKRGDFDFLKATFAWKMLHDFAPESDVQFSITKPYEGADTFEVNCNIDLRKGLCVVSKSFWLPIMDFRFKSIKAPSSRDINDSKLRCFVKNMSFNFGLALELYNGGDFLPNEDQAALISDKQSAQIYKLLEETDSDIDKFCSAFKIATVEELTIGAFERAIQVFERKSKLGGKDA